jgi:hypothetical protein
MATSPGPTQLEPVFVYRPFDLAEDSRALAKAKTRSGLCQGAVRDQGGNQHDLAIL